MKNYFCRNEKIDVNKLYLYDEKLAKKYNAIVNYFNNKEQIFESGCYNSLFNIFYVVEDDYTNKILIYDYINKYTFEIEDSKDLKIDRKYKILTILKH